MKEQIEVITYEQDRLNHFTDLMKKAQKRYKRLFKKHKDAPYLSDEAQALSDAGREAFFLCDVVKMFEKGDREWISVEDRMPPALGKVLVYSPILGVYMTCYTAYSSRFAEKSVTHWMLLPQPPEMKGGAE